MNTPMSIATESKRLLAVFALFSLMVHAACGGASEGGQPAGPPGGGMPPMPVEVVTLTNQQVEQATEFVATLKSRRSTTIQPQVEGFITRIAVRSGDRVREGATLFEVDSAPQTAALASLQSMRVMREAELKYAQQQADRTKKLFEAGAVSESEAELADTSARTTNAQLKSLDDQIRQQQTELGYFKVTAPNTGVVGDIPIRVGDRVTKATVLTTVDENDFLEIYVNVPVQQAPDLKVGVPVRIIDDRGTVLATNAVTFVAPTVDDATQTVLAKATLVDGRGQFRADQFVRAQLVWRSEPGLTIPVTGVTRINGQYFAFVAEAGANGHVAKQKPVQLGQIVGNNYVVREGLMVGELLIVSGLQKIGDGAPVMVGGGMPQKKAS